MISSQPSVLSCWRPPRNFGASWWAPARTGFLQRSAKWFQTRSWLLVKIATRTAVAVVLDGAPETSFRGGLSACKASWTAVRVEPTAPRLAVVARTGVLATARVIPSAFQVNGVVARWSRCWPASRRLSCTRFAANCRGRRAATCWRYRRRAPPSRMPASFRTDAARAVLLLAGVVPAPRRSDSPEASRSGPRSRALLLASAAVSCPGWHGRARRDHGSAVSLRCRGRSEAAELGRCS